MMKRNAIETPEKANELASRIAMQDSEICNVEIIDEPGHAMGGYVQDAFKSMRSISKEAWRNAGFEQALFFSGRSATDCEAVVVIRRDQYEIIMQPPERGIIVVAGVDRRKKSFVDVSEIIKKIHGVLETIPQ